ncbi:MAG: hypothetical protein OHK0046_02070 [Anaerolineae bacterium]
MFVEQFLAAVGWSVLSVVVSTSVSIGLMWWLGLSPKDLAHEIEDVQNVAVGVIFFSISLATALFIAVYFSSGFTEVQSFANSALWFTSGLVLGFIFVVILLFVAHRLLKPTENETVNRWIRRELVEEQNAALALFLGGLTISPFIAVVFQII